MLFTFYTLLSEGVWACPILAKELEKIIKVETIA